MGLAIKLRDDLSSGYVRRIARGSKDAGQVDRLLAIATILDGGSRSEAAKVAGVTLQIIRDWVLRFNEGGPDGLVTRKAPGSTTILGDHHRRAAIATGPIPAVHGVGRRRRPWPPRARPAIRQRSRVCPARALRSRLAVRAGTGVRVGRRAVHVFCAVRRTPRP